MDILVKENNINIKYHALDNDGIAKLGQKIEKGDIIVNKKIP